MNKSMLNSLRKSIPESIGSKLYSKHFSLPNFTLNTFYQSYSSEIKDFFLEIYNKKEVADKLEALLSGEEVNYSEGRAALHHYYRNKNHTKYGFDLVKAVDNLQKKIVKEKYENVFIFGIGGSYEGPKLLLESLFINKRDKIFFITGPDKDEFNTIHNFLPDMISKLCKRHNVKFLINDDPLLVKKINADGCHLGQKDMNILNARKIIGKKIIGITCHNSIKLAKIAIKNKADYIAFGAFYSSKTKKAKYQASIKIINKEGIKNSRVINCLLQLKISKEESKFGLDEKQLKEIIFSTDYKEMNNIKIKGIMAMASNTKNESTIKKEFVFAKKVFNEINSLFTSTNFSLLLIFSFLISKMVILSINSPADISANILSIFLLILIFDYINH